MAVIADYRDARGVHHDVDVSTAPSGAGQVRDVSAANTIVLETLGVGEGQAEAEAIALEYARDQRTACEAAATGRA
jgi:hypothetical protein